MAEPIKSSRLTTPMRRSRPLFALASAAVSAAPPWTPISSSCCAHADPMATSFTRSPAMRRYRSTVARLCASCLPAERLSVIVTRYRDDRVRRTGAAQNVITGSEPRRLPPAAVHALDGRAVEQSGLKAPHLHVLRQSLIKLPGSGRLDEPDVADGSSFVDSHLERHPGAPARREAIARLNLDHHRDGIVRVWTG